MSLPPGTRLGPYEITAQIGVGGRMNPSSAELALGALRD